MEHASKALKLIAESMDLEIEEAKQAGALGYMARAMVQATMPHKQVKDTRFVRTNGTYRLEMVSLQSDIGLPYGVIPRMLMAWISTEAVRTKSPVLVLAQPNSERDSLSDFMGELGMAPTGGRWGTIARLRNQALRLFTTAVSCRFQTGQACVGQNMLIAERYDIQWWRPHDPGQRHLFPQTLTLSIPFFEELTTAPIVIDLRVLRALSKSPLAIDIYIWLTYRMSYLRQKTTIPWAALEVQFGADYTRTDNFRAAFLYHLKRALVQFVSARGLRRVYRFEVSWFGLRSQSGFP